VRVYFGKQAQEAQDEFNSGVSLRVSRMVCGGARARKRLAALASRVAIGPAARSQHGHTGPVTSQEVRGASPEKVTASIVPQWKKAVALAAARMAPGGGTGHLDLGRSLPGGRQYRFCFTLLQHPGSGLRVLVPAFAEAKKAQRDLPSKGRKGGLLLAAPAAQQRGGGDGG